MFTSVLLQPGLNKREDGLTINKGDTRESTYLKRWEMGVRAQECAKNYMTSCDFGIRDVIIVNQNVNLDTMGSNSFGYDLSPAMTQSGEENGDFFVIATANWGMINTPYATLVLFVCLVCQITQMTIF